jgi:hypothetical protein
MVKGAGDFTAQRAVANEPYNSGFDRSAKSLDLRFMAFRRYDQTLRPEALLLHARRIEEKRPFGERAGVDVTAGSAEFMLSRVLGADALSRGAGKPSESRIYKR